MDGAAIAHALFDAMDAGDFEKFESLFAKDARIWHNQDNRDQTVSETAAGLKLAKTVVKSSRYEDRRYFTVPDGAIIQHTLRGTTKNGDKVELFAMMHMYIKDGRIQRIEEYLDPAQGAPIVNALKNR